jgi:ankyrin repeat protein
MATTRPLRHALIAVCLASLVACATQPLPPLHAAIREGNLDAVRTQLAAGGDTSQRDANGLTPLHAAITLGRREIALELIRRGADVNARTRNGSTPLTLAIDKRYLDVLDLLLERNATIDAPTGASALITAVRRNDALLVDRFLRAGAQVDRRSPDGESALHIAANLGHLQLVERLLAAGADVDAAMADGRTPIHYAVLNNQWAAADLLYARGAKVGPASGELGGLTTALVYRQAAERDYRTHATSRSVERLQLAKAAFRSLESVASARADELASQVIKGQALNALALFVGAAKANIDARTSLSGSGSAIVPLASTDDPQRLRDSYKGIATWCDSEAKRMDDIVACVTANPSGDAPCFASKRAS